MENVKEQPAQQTMNTLGKVNEVVMQVLSALTPLEDLDLKRTVLDAVHAELNKQDRIRYYNSRPPVPVDYGLSIEKKD